MITVHINGQFSTCISRWVNTCAFYMSTGSPEGKEAYTPRTELKSRFRSVGKKMTDTRVISGEIILIFSRVRQNAQFSDSVNILPQQNK